MGSIGLLSARLTVSEILENIDKTVLSACYFDPSYTSNITNTEGFLMAMKRDKCITQEQLKTVLGAALSALAESDITIKEMDVEIHPDHVNEEAAKAADVAAPEYPDGDPSSWNDAQRTQAWNAYVADNPEDNDNADDTDAE